MLQKKSDLLDAGLTHSKTDSVWLHDTICYGCAPFQDWKVRSENLR